MRNTLIQLVAAAPDFANWPDTSGPYLGQQPPGMAAELFAPGLISTDQSEIGSVFSPDHNEFYFTTWTREAGTKIMVARQIDGTKVFFGTRRPRPGEVEDKQDGFDI